MRISSPPDEEDTRTVITLLNGKVEIDSQLQTYANLWNQGNNLYRIEVNTQTSGFSSALAGSTMFPFEGTPSQSVVDLSNEDWVEHTTLAYEESGSVLGFPFSIEGWGLIYNADLLESADINPADLTNFSAFQTAFLQLDTQKETLGLDAVVSMASSLDSGMEWVTAHHNLNSLLSSGLAYGDLSLTEDLLSGMVRLPQSITISQKELSIKPDLFLI
ncbi:MAG: hypothetical protein JXR86_14295 [Spirochaetales bacterium]|nr:hypothetical protein [Spirochaetales bacterium]